MSTRSLSGGQARTIINAKSDSFPSSQFRFARAGALNCLASTPGAEAPHLFRGSSFGFT